MKQAPGISTIEYKILNAQDHHLIPDVKGASVVIPTTAIVKGSDVAKIQLTFKVVENNDNAEFISNFLNVIRLHLLFRVTFVSQKIAVIGSEDFKPAITFKQIPGEKPGDFVGYIFEVSWDHPLFV